MKTRFPNYIPSSALQETPLSHAWDDWDPYPLIGKSNKDTEQLLSHLSNYGKFIFSLGCAEWVVARFHKYLENKLPWQYIDACWAFELTSDFMLPIELDDREWEGPILGPICLSLTTVVNTRYGFDEDNAEIDSAFAEKVALHVIPDNRLFIAWRNFILERMATICLMDNENPDGKRLPREVLDPSSNIDLKQSPLLLLKAKKDLDIEKNPYVNAFE